MAPASHLWCQMGSRGEWHPPKPMGGHQARAPADLPCFGGFTPPPRVCMAVRLGAVSREGENAVVETSRCQGAGAAGPLAIQSNPDGGVLAGVTTQLDNPARGVKPRRGTVSPFSGLLAHHPFGKVRNNLHPAGFQPGRRSGHYPIGINADRGESSSSVKVWGGEGGPRKRAAF